MRSWVIALIPVVLGGCTMGDLNFGLSSGGLVAEQMTTDIFGIKSNPNASTEDVLIKAAQTTKSIGATHFKLISADDVGRPLDVGIPGGPSSPTGAMTTATASASIRPGRDTYIRVLRLAPGQEPPGGYFSADEIIGMMGRGKRG